MNSREPGVEARRPVRRLLCLLGTDLVPQVNWCEVMGWKPILNMRASSCSRLGCGL